MFIIYHLLLRWYRPRHDVKLPRRLDDVKEVLGLVRPKGVTGKLLIPVSATASQLKTKILL